MYAITIDEEKYISDFSDRTRKPESILVNAIPEKTDIDKLRCYQYVNDKFVFDAEKWAKIENNRADHQESTERERKISHLKAQLEGTDYQIIKCYEYALNNLSLPYDVEKLHAERQALRDQINELESNINVEKTGL